MIDRYHKWPGFSVGRSFLAGCALLAAVSGANSEPLDVLIKPHSADGLYIDEKVVPGVEKALAGVAGEPVRVRVCPLQAERVCDASTAQRVLQIDVYPPVQVESSRGITLGVAANPRSPEYGQVTRLPVSCRLSGSDGRQAVLEVEARVSRSHLYEAGYLAEQLVKACGELLAVRTEITSLSDRAAAEAHDVAEQPAVRLQLDGRDAVLTTGFGGAR